MLKNWRAGVLLLLFLGPFAAYMGFGFLWLRQQGWLMHAFVLWVAAGIVFAILAARWTKPQRQILPPLDWDQPHTFSPFDRKAWELVQEEADKGDALSMDQLSEFDIYIDTGRRLARRLASHYHPLSHDPIEHVAVVELLTALELAAEDLDHLCRQVPGGDLVTPAHWKRAVQAAEYINRANDIYSYLLPIFQPMTGLVRLGTQRLMVKPAWKTMQQNLLRWFYQAFVNRLGTHLIELYSGRLSIGVDQYRRLTRRTTRSASVDAEPQALTIAVAGARDSGKSRLIAALEQARGGDMEGVKVRLAAAGFDDSLVERLRTAKWQEVAGYTTSPGAESARDRATRRAAVDAAVDADMLLLVIDGRREGHAADVAFIQSWDRWYMEHPGLEMPPVVAVVTGADRPDWGGQWDPPHDWVRGQGLRETAVRARLDTLRIALPPTVTELVTVGLGDASSSGIIEAVMPALASLLHRAERVSLIRYLHNASHRSKAGRLISQVGQQGRQLWQHLKDRRGGNGKAG